MSEIQTEIPGKVLPCRIRPGSAVEKNRLNTVCDNAEAASLIFSGAAYEFRVVAAD